MKKTNENHAFSIELNHKGHLQSLVMPNTVNGNLVIEGVLGKLLSACFVEDSMLEIRGVNGTLRIDLSNEEFKTLISEEVKR
jgi:hypothetical protein